MTETSTETIYHVDTKNNSAELLKELGINEQSHAKEVAKIQEIIADQQNVFEAGIITVTTQALSDLKTDIEKKGGINGELGIDTTGTLTYKKNETPDSVGVPEAEAVTSTVAAIVAPAVVQEVKKTGGFGGVFDKLGNMLGKLGEMFSTLMASMRGFESLDDEALLSSFTAKLSPEAKKAVSEATTYSMMSFLGKREDIRPITEALREICSGKRGNSEKMKNLANAVSAGITEAKTGSEIAEIIRQYKGEYREDPKVLTPAETAKKQTEDAEKQKKEFITNIRDIKTTNDTNKDQYTAAIPTAIANEIKTIGADGNPTTKSAYTDIQTFGDMKLEDIARIGGGNLSDSSVKKLHETVTTYLATNKDQGNQTLIAILSIPEKKEEASDKKACEKARNTLWDKDITEQRYNLDPQSSIEAAAGVLKTASNKESPEYKSLDRAIQYARAKEAVINLAIGFLNAGDKRIDFNNTAKITAENPSIQGSTYGDDTGWVKIESDVIKFDGNGRQSIYIWSDMNAVMKADLILAPLLAPLNQNIHAVRNILIQNTAALQTKNREKTTARPVNT